MQIRQALKRSWLRLDELEQRTAPAALNALVSRADPSMSSETAGGLDTVFTFQMIRSDARPTSGDGRYVAFTSSSGNVVPGQIDSNGSMDVFFYDRVSNTTELISHAYGSPMTASNRYSYDATLSADGRYIAFVSNATNLVPGLVNPSPNTENVFLYDRVAETCALVSHQNDSPSIGQNALVEKIKISANGHTIIFTSAATNLAPNMPNETISHAYAYSVATGKVTLLDHAYGDPSVPGNDFGFGDDVSADGRYVVISSYATNLTNPPTDNNPLVADNGFRYDMVTGQNLLITKSAISGNVGCNGGFGYPRISADGNRISFRSAGTDLIPGYVGSKGQVFEYDVAAGQMLLVSHAFGSPSTAANGRSYYFPSISLDGEFIAYQSEGTNLIDGFVDGNDGAYGDIFIWNRTTGQNSLVSRKAGTVATSGNGSGLVSDIALDGSLVLFSNTGTDLVAGFVDGNSAEESSLFAFDRLTGQVTLIGGRFGSQTMSANQTVQNGSVSSDGSTIVFTSPASDIISGLADLNGSDDVFVRDVATGSTVVASRRFGDPSHSPGGESTWVRQSADGRFVVYVSKATNIAPGQVDSENSEDVFLHDRQLNTTLLVSHAYDGSSTAANNQSSQPMISADGRYVAYYSWATNLVPNFVDSNGPPVAGDSYRNTDVFLFDRVAGTNTLVSHKAGMPNVGGNQSSGAFQSYIDYFLTISGDGRYVSYFTLATDLVAGFVDHNGTTESNRTGSDIFVYDRTTDSNKVVSHQAGSALHSSNDSSYSPNISADGRYIAYWSYAYTVVNGMSAAHSRNVFIYDQQTGLNTLASHMSSSNTLGGNGWSAYPAISKDGNYVVYLSYATNLVGGSDSNGQNDVFLYNRQSNSNTLVSHAYNSAVNAGNAISDIGIVQSISDDGRFVVYDSGATNLVSGYVQGYSAAPYPSDVYLFDRTTGNNTLISHAVGSPTTGGNRRSRSSAISGNGRFVAFFSEANNLIAGNFPYFGNIYAYDGLLSTMTLVSHALNDPETGTYVASSSSVPSYDGSVISYLSPSDNLVAGDFNVKQDVFAYITPPPRVHSVQINDGSAQRSVIRSVAITFDDYVFLDTGHLSLVNSQGSGVSCQELVQYQNNSTILTLTFAGANTEFGSLADGNYTLTIFANGVSGVGQLDGNGDSVGGDDHIFTFHRLFGDGNGDRRVDSGDFALFRQVFGTPGIAFDFNDDGNIGATDFVEFRKRFGLNLL